jgi:YVTN family beta-propeller protein
VAAHRAPPRRATRMGTAQTRPQAIVTDESQNLIAVVDLRSGTARQFFGMPAGPQYVAFKSGLAVITSPSAGAVSVLRGDPLKHATTLRGFDTPRVDALSPDRQHAYVTDDAAGTLTVIDLRGGKVMARVNVGAGAHHMASSPDQSRLWVALSESARVIVIVDTADLGHPKVIGQFSPGFPAHDLAFSPSGQTVWVTSAAGPDVTVFSAADHRRLFTVPVGPPPQHITFGDGYAYATSGYGSKLEQVSISTGKVIRSARSPYGSFELAAADGYVATASLLDGEVAIYTPGLKRLRVLKIGPATRDIAISDP